MADHLTKDKRSWNMRQIKSRHTKPEVLVRSLLHRAGFRFKINDKKLPGKPDIVLPKYKTVIFVHGCFWHRHPNCPKATNPKTNADYWKNKFKKNILRDKKIQEDLKKLNWRIVLVWECEVLSDPISVISNIISQLTNNGKKKYKNDLSPKELLRLAEQRSKFLTEKD